MMQRMSSTFIDKEIHTK